MTGLEDRLCPHDEALPEAGWVNRLCPPGGAAPIAKADEGFRPITAIDASVDRRCPPAGAPSV